MTSDFGCPFVKDMRPCLCAIGSKILTSTMKLQFGTKIRNGGHLKALLVENICDNEQFKFNIYIFFGNTNLIFTFFW
jgi:hypothetical protein